MKLEEYIEQCEAVVHFVGDMTGSAPKDYVVNELLTRRSDLKTRLPPLGAALDAGVAVSYTQWEAWLALYFRKDLVIAAPAPAAADNAKSPAAEGGATAQSEHLKRLREVGRCPEIKFADRNDLVAQIFASVVIDALVKAAALPARQPRNLPFASLGDLFKGRDKALDDLRAALLSGKGAAVTGRALHGLGGIGKTRLAIEYALCHAGDYSALLFVRADSPATLNASLAALAGAEVLDLPEKEAREDAAKIEAALRWLADHPTWLMILDNVDDGEAVGAVDDLMARLNGGHVIITARAADFPESIRTLELDALDEDAASLFLLERTAGRRETAKDDEAQARALARELGGLALGLVQAGAQIAKQRISFARYMKLWSENRDKVLGWSDPNMTRSEKTLATTWVTSVAQLSAESRRLLDRLAFLAPDPIPDSLLDVPVPGEAGDYDPYEARAGLYAYSLAAQAKGEDGAAKGFVVHRLVQDFARRAMTDDRRAEAVQEALRWVNAAFKGDPGDVRTWPVLDPLAPHALAVARSSDEAGIAEPTGRLMGTLAILSEGKARYADAEWLKRRALAIGEATLRPNDPELATRLNNLAELLRATNRLPEAEPLYRRAIAIWETSLGPNHPQVALGVNNLAALLHSTNRLGEAEPLYRRALAIRENSYGPDHPDVAQSLNNLASLLQTTNQLAEAEPLQRRALKIDEASYGPDHPDVAQSLNNLAELLRVTNRLGEAEPLYRRALAIREKSYGPDHPDVAQSLNNLAGLLKQANRLREAEPLFRRALAIDEASYGPDHPTVATRLNNLAELFKQTNRLAEAEPLYRRALAIFEKSYGPDHPSVAIGLNNLAGLLYQTNRLAEAETCYRRALKIDLASFGPDHPSVAIRLNNLAGLLRHAHRLADAEPLYRRALAIFAKSHGADHPSTVTVRKNLAVLLAELGKRE
jgi:tetratricopeptide (TPR) repeat protein